MSSIKSDSLFSNFKNLSFHHDIRPNQSTSNFFRSIFGNMDHNRQKSIKIQSIFQLNAPFQPVPQSLSLMDKLITTSSKQKFSHAYHYNWTVCKNSGVSEEEDNEEASNSKSKRQTQNSEIKIQQKQNQQLKEEFQQKEKSPNESVKKMKNQTKNIPKNYGKAIISFIQKNRPYIEVFTKHYNVDYDQLLLELKKKKRTINTIADLRSLWSHYEYSKCMRVITCVFLRKHALKYIFDSRICTYTSHIKYRQRLCEAVANPDEFKHIKDF